MCHKHFTGRHYCEEKGIAFHFNSRDHRFSNSSLRKEVAAKEMIKVVQKNIFKAGFLCMKKILITGGACFIGSQVLRLFVNTYPEYQIFNLDAMTCTSNLEN